MKSKDKPKAKQASSGTKTRKARNVRRGEPTKISKAMAMLLSGTTMAKIEEATGDTSYAAVRKLENQGYTFDRSVRDGEGRIFYKAIAPAKVEVNKAA